MIYAVGHEFKGDQPWTVLGDTHETEEYISANNIMVW